MLQTAEDLAQQQRTWGSSPTYDTEEQMAEYFRRNNVRTILDFGFTKNMTLDQVRPFHDYAIDTQQRFSDVIFGNWLQIDPRLGGAAVDEMRRCIDESDGFIGYCVSAAGMGFPASDPIYDPFYRLSLDNDIPVLVLVGYTGSGAGIPGGKGVKLDLCHPRYVDELAINYPTLKIITGRPAWPWQDEMIAVMLHKPNVWAELHGWSPKYLTEPLRRDIARRLKDRVMFGADYPLFRYERLVADWKTLGFDEETLERVFHRNAEKLFAPQLQKTLQTQHLDHCGSRAEGSRRRHRRIERGHRLRHRRVVRVRGRGRDDRRAPQGTARELRPSRCAPRPARACSRCPPISGAPMTAHASSNRPRPSSAASTCWSTTTARRRSACSTSSMTPHGTRRSSRT